MERKKAMERREKFIMGFVRLWTAALAVMTVVYSFYSSKFPGIGTVKTFGILLFGMLDLLFLALWVAGGGGSDYSRPQDDRKRSDFLQVQDDGKCLDFMRFQDEGKRPDSSQPQDNAGGRRLARFLWFLAGTAAFLLWCFRINTAARFGIIWDSIVLASLICVCALCGEKRK